ncbi:MAG: hypothetical protein H0U50_06110, partial [Pyrinomonadaceae bacterium]|nr:hypothetical protein [Pyrinomonadaceae bacterium]
FRRLGALQIALRESENANGNDNHHEPLDDGQKFEKAVEKAGLWRR